MHEDICIGVIMYLFNARPAVNVSARRDDRSIEVIKADATVLRHPRPDHVS